ncbi:MAG: DNA-packaging protein [Clostridia bacterium]|nr:DNA-packaging protein [Clostridia bacterium]
MGNFGKYKIKTPEELREKIEAYFKACDEHQTKMLLGQGANAKVESVPDPQPYTVTGLALAVGLSSRLSLLGYAERDGFAEVLEEARAKIEAQWESKLSRLGNNNGVMFALMNNSKFGGWANKSQQDLNVGGQTGNPLQVNSTVETVHKLSEDQLEQIEKILKSAEVNSILD